MKTAANCELLKRGNLEYIRFICLAVIFLELRQSYIRRKMDFNWNKGKLNRNWHKDTK